MVNEKMDLVLKNGSYYFAKVLILFSRKNEILAIKKSCQI
jgi:hypothetical protein